MRKVEISVLVLTKNRAKLLRKCLCSLMGQLHKYDEVVLVNNNSSDDTVVVCNEFAKVLPIKYIFSQLVGYPRLYNLAIKKSIKPYVVFFDDDCVAVNSWREKIERAIALHPNDIVQGSIRSIPKGNIYAEIMGDHYQNWVASHLVGENQLDTFDNKNLIVPRTVFFSKSNFFGFDERLELGAEDIELGKRLSIQGKVIWYERSIVAAHHERTTFQGFVQQHYRIAQGESFLSYHLPKSNVPLFPLNKTIRNIRSFAKREIVYLGRFELFSALYTVFLYLVLCCIRVYGYQKRY